MSVRLATVWLDGCSGCHMSVLDTDERLIELAGNGYAGVLNVAGSDAISRYELGLLVAERDGIDPERLPHGPIPAGLTLPADIRLTIGKATGLLRTRLRGCREFIPEDTAAAPTGPGGW